MMRRRSPEVCARRLVHRIRKAASWQGGTSQRRLAPRNSPTLTGLLTFQSAEEAGAKQRTHLDGPRPRSNDDRGRQSSDEFASFLGSAQFLNADRVARRIPDSDVANPIRLHGRLLNDLGATGLHALKGCLLYTSDAAD